MQARSRRKRILDALETQKTVYVKDLAAELDVSDMTIRRDLHRLADMGVTTLIHGGAVFNEGMVTNATANARATKMMKEKERLAAFCAGLVREGNAIYLDTGTTVMEIAKSLKYRQNIAVLTNSLPVQNILSSAEKIQLISMPGIYHAGERGHFGEMTCRMIRSFRIDIAFVGVSSIDIPTGLMTPFFHEQSTKMAMLESAGKKIAVFDHTKIGKTFFTQVCPISALSMLVTDTEADEDFVKAARRKGVEVVQV